MIIIVNGVAKSGKNTFVGYCQEYTDKRIWHVSSIDKVKSFCYDMYGVEYWVKSDENRRIWHETKMKYKDLLFWDMCKDLKLLTTNSIAFVDVREPEEIQRYVDHFKTDIYTLLIRRPNIPIPDNNADKQVMHFKYTHIIDNTGTLDELKQKAKNFINILPKKGK